MVELSCKLWRDNVMISVVNLTAPYLPREEYALMCNLFHRRMEQEKKPSAQYTNIHQVLTALYFDGTNLDV